MYSSCTSHKADSKSMSETESSASNKASNVTKFWLAFSLFATCGSAVSVNAFLAASAVIAFHCGAPCNSLYFSRVISSSGLVTD